eukprot:13214953-Alexandrium_andersonii.AAC.1
MARQPGWRTTFVEEATVNCVVVAHTVPNSSYILWRCRECSCQPSRGGLSTRALALPGLCLG